MRIQDPGENKSGSGINIPNHISDSNNFWVEILISLSIQCCGTGFGIRCLFDPGSGMEKSRFWILDKHTGSGTLHRKSPFTPSAEYWYGMRWLKYRSSVISSDLYTGRRRQRRHLHQRWQLWDPWWGQYPGRQLQTARGSSWSSLLHKLATIHWINKP